MGGVLARFISLIDLGAFYSKFGRCSRPSFDLFKDVGLPVFSVSYFFKFLVSRGLLMIWLFYSPVVIAWLFPKVAALAGAAFVTLSKSLFEPSFFFVV